MKQTDDDFILVALWIDGANQEYRHAKEVAASYNKDTFYVSKLPNLNLQEIPAVICWNGDQEDFDVSIGY